MAVPHIQATDNNDITLTEEGFSVNSSSFALITSFHSTIHRDSPENIIIKKINEILQKAKENEDVELIKSLFKIIFNKRWCRGGEGNKNVFYISLLYLIQYFEQIIYDLFPLFEKYGYIKDALNILNFSEKTDYYKIIYNKVVELYSNNLNKDLENLKDYESSDKKEHLKISFTAKWAPRESKKTRRLIGDIGRKLYPNSSDSKKIHELYRKDIVKLNKYLNVVEILMSANQWAEIEFKNVCSQAINRNKSAFMNLKRNDKNELVQRSTNEDRIKCAENFLKQISENKIKGSQVDPAIMISELFNKRSIEENKKLASAQFESYIDSIIKMIQTRKDELKSCNQDIGRWVAVADVSGSMTGTPMMISIAMALIISHPKIANSNFANRFITFDTHPQWISFSQSLSTDKKVNIIKNSPWGGSTNYDAVHDLLIKTCDDNDVKIDEIPEGIVTITDMQFNEACGYNCNWSTAYERIKQKWKVFGRRKYKKNIKPPIIVFWNTTLRQIDQFPVESTQEGVILCCGNSGSHIKNILSGEFNNKTTPETAVKSILNDQQLAPLDEILNRNSNFIKEKLIYIKDDLFNSDNNSVVSADD